MKIADIGDLEIGLHFPPKWVLVRYLNSLKMSISQSILIAQKSAVVRIRIRWIHENLAGLDLDWEFFRGSGSKNLKW